MEQATATKPHPRAQSSIRSFFQPRQSNYVPPLTSTNSNASGDIKISPSCISPRVSSDPPNLQMEPEIKLPASSPALPPEASISPILEKHIQQLKRINSLLLPITYPDSFYRKITDPQISPNFSRVILWQDSLPLKSPFSTNSDPKVVGGIVCRLERDEHAKNSSIYIQSLVLLSPYRSRGLATAVLENIINSVLNLPTTEFPVTSLYAHVWVQNTEGLEWYAARGFHAEEPVVQGYYRRLQPGNAWIIRRPIGPGDYLRHSTSHNQFNALPSASQKSTSTTTPAPPPLPALASAHVISASSVSKQTVSSSTQNPPTPTHATSYQTTGPGHEWNDLPDDILTSKPQTPEPSPAQALLKPDNANTGTNGSAASSRSSSSTRNGGGRKKKREYPAAAFNAGGAST